MSRRSVSADSSLELLLDTICNTFGGVLFIAILVTVLLRMTVKVADPGAPPGMSVQQVLELQSRKEKLLADVDGLRQAQRQQRELEDRFAQPETAPLLQELVRLREERSRLQQARTLEQSELKSAQEEMELARRDVENFSNNLGQARAVAIQLETALAAELESRTTKASLPRVRETFKREVGIFLRYGRMYLSRKYDRHGDRQGPNLDEFFVLEDDLLRKTLTPKPYAGTPIEDGVKSGAIADRLRPFSPQENYLAIIVWDDSFDEFQSLKKVVLEMGFEYRLIPNEAGGSVFEGAIGRSEVQ